MKISFVIGGLPTVPVSTWGEIIKSKNKGSSAYSLEDYWRVKGLELNTEFENEILKTRNKIGIPKEGLKYEEITTHYYPEDYVWITDVNLKNKTVAFDKSVEFETERILKEFDCDLFVSKQIKSILLSNIVLPLFPYISDSGEISIKTLFIEDDLDREEYIKSEKEVLIRITSKVSPNAVIQFIEDRRKLFTNLFNELPEKKKCNLSDEKIKIVLERRNNPNITFNKLSIILANKENINKIPKTLNKDYEEAEKYISSLFYKNTKKTH